MHAGKGIIFSLFLSWDSEIIIIVIIFFFSIGFSFTDTDNSQDVRGRVGTIFYSTLPLPPTHEHSDINLQLCMWDNYHIFLIAPLVFTRLSLDEIYNLTELPFDWLMMWYWFWFCLLDDLILGFYAMQTVWLVRKPHLFLILFKDSGTDI